MKTIEEIKNEMQEHSKQMEIYAEFATPYKYDEEKAQIYYYHLREFNKARKQYNTSLDELAAIKRQNKNNESFINSYGEHTERYITTTTYKNAQKRLNKQILNFIS